MRIPLRVIMLGSLALLAACGGATPTATVAIPCGGGAAPGCAGGIRTPPPTMPTAIAATASAATQPPGAAISAARPTATNAPIAARDLMPTLQEFAVPKGAGPHDVAPAPDGTVWYTAQRTGELGRLDPKTGETRQIALGPGSAPHGVIVGPDGAAWVTDGGLNAIVRVDPATLAVRAFPLPANRANASLNTAAFDARGILWFTGQDGIYGRLDPQSGTMTVYDAPKGAGPYGIIATSDGAVWYASLAGNYVGRIDPQTGVATVLDPPTREQGARRVWADSRGRVWVTEWTAGRLGLYDPATQAWREWRLPGPSPLAYAVYVDERDLVWVTDFGANAILRFDPAREAFDSFPLPTAQAYVRQLLGRPGEVWGAESGTDKLVVIRTAAR